MKIKIGLLMRAKTEGHIHDQFFINQDYIKAFDDLNVNVTLIYPSDEESLEANIKECHGLVIPGGMDVDPYFYNQDNTHSSCEPYEVDQMDINAIHIAQSLNIPLFGICRGLQVINVALGGTLKQDIPNHNLSSNTHRLKGHLIHIEKDTILHEIFGSRSEVNSYHHQAIDKCAASLNVIAQSDDGIIEAVIGQNILAVQWHPERMTSFESTKALFKSFVEQCK